MDYVPQTTPWKHQAEAFDRFKGAPYAAIIFEQRCGKTKVVLDIAAYRFERNEIDALLIVALPAGIPRNWASDEIPAHLPDRIPRMTVVWSATKAKTKKFQAELDTLIAFKGLAILAVNGEAIITRSFAEYVGRFLKARRAFVAADESSLLCKTPGTSRTRALHAIGRHPNVVAKAILDGTPAGEGPFDLYAQFMFLSWRIFGFTSYFAFKQRYAKWSKGFRWDPTKNTNVEYPVLDAYQNLDELAAKMAPCSMRVTRRECFPNMPPQIFSRVRFELSPEQRRVYDQLRDQYEAELSDLTHITARHVLTRMLRLQQIAGNVWPGEKAYAICGACGGNGCPDCDGIGAIETRTPPKIIDPAHDPRLEALEDQLSRTNEPFIVWCRFIHDVDATFALTQRLGRSPVRYDGTVPPDQKAVNKKAFQTGKAGALIGNPTSGGRGLTLKSASTIFNYSHFFSIMTYEQGNDRAEDPTAARGKAIVDLTAEDTVDDDIVEAHRAKKSVVDYVMERRAIKGTI
jgi:hypothetical protein